MNGFSRRSPRSAARLLSSVGLGLGLVLGAGAVDAQVVFPLQGAPYSAAVMAPAGSTLAVFGVEGVGADIEAASRDALGKMEARLTEVGLSRDQVLRVRAALPPGRADTQGMAAWNTAWNAHFNRGHVPARVTVGASALPPNTLIVLDVVAAFPADRERPARVDGARPTLNPNIRYAGPAANPTAIVSTQAGLYLSSGILPNPATLEDVESMEQQMRATMNVLTGVLARHGLQWHDVFYTRVLPTPQPGRPSVDFAAWAPVRSTLDEITGGHAPPFSMWAAPGFSATRRYVEIEVWAVPHAPHPVFEVIDMEAQNPLLRMTGTGFIADGAIVAPNPELIFLSGIVAPEGTPPQEEGAAVLDIMKARLAEMGASMSDVAELRVYRIDGEEGFNAAYSANFNNPETNPHRPVRTNYLVDGIPGGRLVEVEAIVVRPPRRF